MIRISIYQGYGWIIIRMDIYDKDMIWIYPYIIKDKDGYMDDGWIYPYDMDNKDKDMI